jgi:hemoglobin-like flavoprotein
MNEQEIRLVRQSFERATRFGPHFAATFYAELFAIDPSIRPMFSGDMIVQGQQLVGFLRYLVEGIANPAAILPAARELGVRHTAYGVEARHYPMVQTALLRTFRHELGVEFTPETRTAWIAAYKLLADTMCEAAYGKDGGPTR